MKQFSLKNAMTTLKVLSLASIAALALTSCGGGSAADGNKATVRPKSLDGIYLYLNTPTNARLEFVRNTSSNGAIENGDVETGVFFYTLSGNNLTVISNRSGTSTNTRFPDSVIGGTYSYRAVNGSAGVITLNGVADNDGTNSGAATAGNGSFADLFDSDSTGAERHTLEMDVTFSDSNGTALPDTSTLRIVGSTSNFDVLALPISANLVIGGSLPTNYDPTVDPSRPSRIAPESLGNKRFVFTSNAGAAFNMTIQFTADTVGSPSSSFDESGTGLLRRNGAIVDNGVNYTWTRIDGTDAGKLVITNAESTLNGTYTLDFTGTTAGTYLGTTDADTTDVNEVSGTFTLN